MAVIDEVEEFIPSVDLPDADVWEMLSDEEATLYALLMDHSGIDLMEFCLVDESAPWGCWRAWPFQWPWWRDQSEKAIDQAARAIGKSQSLKGRALSFPFRQPGQEMVITAPQQMHVDAITDQIEHAINDTRLLREMLVAQRRGITHRPFKVTFANGARVISRIPQKTGVGVKGCLVAGTMIRTRDGDKPIESIVAGELVWTHEGRWRRVTAVHHYASETTFAVDVDGHPGIQCSPEHPLYARVGMLVDVVTDEGAEWLRADDIHALLAEGDQVWVAAADKHAGTVCQFESDEETIPDGAGGMRVRPAHWFSEVTAVRELRGADVYDLTVDDDHSYIADGLVVHNTHPVCLELDEGQDYPDRGWTEIIETFNRAIDGAEWRIHGVPRGIPDKFQELITDAPGNGFTLHRYTAIHRPTWTPEEREAKLKEYGGSENSPDFRRNVYGEMGDATNRIFELRRFMHCVDTVEGSDYNLDEYHYRSILAEQVEDRVSGGGRLEEATTDEHAAALIAMCAFPEMHRQRYSVFWAGMDVGLTSDPTEILVAAEYKPNAAERKADERAGIAIPLDGATRLKVVTRIRLDRIPEPLQVQLIMALIDFYKPRAFSLDKTGIGVGILQGLQAAAHKSRFVVDDADLDENLTPQQRQDKTKKIESARNTLTVIKGYNFGEKVVVEIDETEADKLPPGLTVTEIAEKAGIRRNVKEYATDCLRALVDTRRLLLPFDKDLINQWNGQTWQYDNSPVDAYGRRKQTFSVGTFHCLDAGRMLALGYFQAPIEAMLKVPAKKRGPVLAQFVT